MADLFSAIIGAVVALIPGLAPATAPSYSGYVEGRYLYVTPLSGGQIEALPVAAGDRVAAGVLLMRLRSPQLEQAVKAAEAQLAAAAAGLENLTTGSRADEVAVIRASLAKAEASRDLAADTATRTQKLFEQGVVSKSRLDQDAGALTSAEAAVRELEAQLKVSELPARSAQQAQAEAEVDVARANLSKAQADLADRTLVAPASGRIEQVYFSAGEMLAAGAPLLALLPDGAAEVKFYLPEGVRTQFLPGTKVAVSCDGCPDGLVATVTRLASDPDYTPPVIYSRDERQRLSFLAEALLPADIVLPPGQPVSVGALE
jgi:HlyD family secretion protein